MRQVSLKGDVADLGILRLMHVNFGKLNIPKVSDTLVINIL